jgi:hypothetical protein
MGITVMTRVVRERYEMTSTNSSRRTVDAADVTATGKKGKSATPSRDPEDIRADIQRTRADLSDTVETLAGRADVKGRARNKATELTSRGRDKVAEVKTRAKDTAVGVTEGAKDTGRRVAGTARRRAAPLAAAVAAVGTAVGAVVMIRRRRSAQAKRRPWQRLPWRR